MIKHSFTNIIISSFKKNKKNKMFLTVKREILAYVGGNLYEL